MTYGHNGEVSTRQWLLAMNIMFCIKPKRERFARNENMLGGYLYFECVRFPMQKLASDLRQGRMADLGEFLKLGQFF